MGIRNAGRLIYLARKKKKISQEKLCEGICTVSKLSQIEKGKLGVSPSLFHTLSSRMGSDLETIPCFFSKEDFNCYLNLKHANFYFKNLSLEKVYEELEFVEKIQWAHNKFYYAEWVFLNAKLQFFTHCNHKKNYDFLIHGLLILNSKLNIYNIREQLLSQNELEMLILLAEELLYLKEVENCYKLANDIYQYITDSQLNESERNRLLAEITVVLCKYYIVKKDYEMVLQKIEPHLKCAKVESMDLPLLRLNFLKGIALYYTSKKAEGILLMKAVIVSSKSLDCCYDSFCKENLIKYTDFTEDLIFSKETKKLKMYKEKYHIYPIDLSDGVFDLFSKEALSFGELVHDLRVERGISLHSLSTGICSESKLSKIEHNILQPDIFLCEVLLQRLGLSERIFDFWGNKDQNELSNLRFRAIHSIQLEYNEMSKILEEIENLLPKNDTLLKQFFLLRSAAFCVNPTEKIEMLFQAIYCTLPEFNIYQIHQYNLSWAELSALNSIAHTYIKTNYPSKSIYYFFQLMSYYQNTYMDINYKETVYIPMLEMFCHVLYNQKYYEDIGQIFNESHFDILKYSSNLYSFFLFYYSQAMGECGRYKEALEFGSQSYALSIVNGLNENANALKRYLLEDYGLKIEL